MTWLTLTLSPSGPRIEVPDPPGDMPEEDLGNASGNVAIDFPEVVLSRYATMTVTGNTTITSLVTYPQGYVQLRVTNAGAFTLAWPAAIRWPNGGASPVLTPNRTDFFNFYTDRDGVVWGQAAQDFS